jgi:hypothetical protein
MNSTTKLCEVIEQNKEVFDKIVGLDGSSLTIDNIKLILHEARKCDTELNQFLQIANQIDWNLVLNYFST